MKKRGEKTSQGKKEYAGWLIGEEEKTEREKSLVYFPSLFDPMFISILFYKTFCGGSAQKWKKNMISLSISLSLIQLWRPKGKKKKKKSSKHFIKKTRGGMSRSRESKESMNIYICMWCVSAWVRVQENQRPKEKTSEWLFYRIKINKYEIKKVSYICIEYTSYVKNNM